MEDVVDLPFPGQREFDGEWGDDFLDLEGAVVLVIQLLGGAPSLDVPTIEHYQVADLVCRRLLACGVCVPAHSILC